MSWWCALAGWLLAGCQIPPKQPNLERVRRSQPLLGTFVTITAYGPDRERAQQAVSAAFDEFHRIDALMSLHRPDSELSRLNRSAARGPVEISGDLFRVLAKAQEIASETDGAFDVTIRPLVDAWGFIWKEYRLLTEAELRAVLPRVDFRQVELSSGRRTVRFRKANVSLDLGGIAKGYAVDCAIERLRSLGVTNAMVKAGGDLRVIGAPPGKPAWEVQLEDPRKKGRRTRIPLRDAALSTSGNYENYFVAGGKRYSHILNPRTGLPVEGIAACTVIAPTCMESDAWATACFVQGAAPSLNQLGRRFAIRFTLMPEASQPEEWRVRQTPSFP
ncbi:MAG: FAD:protein FMN transferase [Verrucomicrobiota bacterium]